MVNRFSDAILIFAAVLVFSSTALVQTTQPQQAGGTRSPWKFYPD